MFSIYVGEAISNRILAYKNSLTKRKEATNEEEIEIVKRATEREREKWAISFWAQVTLLRDPMNTFAFVCVVVMQNTLFQLIYVLSTVHINPVLFHFSHCLVIFLLLLLVILSLSFALASTNCLDLPSFSHVSRYEYANVPIELSLL